MTKAVRSFQGWSVWKWMILICFVIVVFGVLGFLDWRSAVVNLLGLIDDWGAIGWLIFGLAYVVACVLMLPGSLLTLGAGMVFGLTKGFLLVSVSSVAGATAAFLVGRYLARATLERKLINSTVFQNMADAVAQEGFKIVGLTRLSPVLPFNMLNYAFGLTRVSLRDYVLASWMGMIPGTLMYVYVGSLAGTLLELEVKRHSTGPTILQWVLYVVGLVATILATMMITRIAGRALKQRINNEQKL